MKFRVLILSLAFYLLALAPDAQATSLPSPASRTLAQCVSTSHRLMVLVMMDESGSLKQTDPSNERVTGLRSALAGLARLADTPVDGVRPSVEVLLTGFSSTVEPKLDSASRYWQSLTDTTLDSLEAKAGSYTTRSTGRDTDYGTALLAARALLAERAAQLTTRGGSEPCKALVWFTDGQYSIEDRVGTSALPGTVAYAPTVRLDKPGAGIRAVAAGKRFLCRPSGLMDGLESDGVVNFTVGLSVQMSAQASSFLNAVTTGSGGGYRCGATLSPRTGDYLKVGSANRLFFAFANLLQGISVPPRPFAVCPIRPCERGSSAFRTIPDLARFQLLATTGAGGVEIVLTAPDGAHETLRPGSLQTFVLSGATVTERWITDRYVQVEGVLQPTNTEWLGNWSYAFVDPTGRRTAVIPLSSAQLFTDLQPALITHGGVVLGQPTQVQFGLMRSTGERVTTGALPQSAKVRATLTDPGGETSIPLQVSRQNDSVFGTLVDLPTHWEEAAASLVVDLSFGSVGTIPVAPVTRVFHLTARTPAAEGFPTVSPPSLQLPSVSGKAPTRASLTVTASHDAAGCVWFETPQAAGPGSAGEVSFFSIPNADSSRKCLHIAAGESRPITIVFRPTHVSIGTVRIALPVKLGSSVVRNKRTVKVRVSFDLFPEAKITERVAIVIALTIIGMGFPLLLLHILNLVSARFAPPQYLLALIQDILITPGLTVEALDGGGLRSRYGEFEALSSTGIPRSKRRLWIDGLNLKAVASGSLRDRFLSLFTGPYGIAEAEGREIIAGPDPKLRRWRKARRLEVPLTLVGTWIFVPTSVVTEDGPLADENLTVENDYALDSKQVAGRLMMFIADSEDHRQGERLAGEATIALLSRDWTNATPASQSKQSFLTRLRDFGRGVEQEEQFEAVIDQGSPSGSEQDDGLWVPEEDGDIWTVGGPGDQHDY